MSQIAVCSLPVDDALKPVKAPMVMMTSLETVADPVFVWVWKPS